MTKRQTTYAYQRTKVDTQWRIQQTHIKGKMEMSHHFPIFMYVSWSCVSFMFYIFKLFDIHVPLFVFSLCVCWELLVVHVVPLKRSSTRIFMYKPKAYLFTLTSNKHVGILPFFGCMMKPSVSSLLPDSSPPDEANSDWSSSVLPCNKTYFR